MSTVTITPVLWFHSKGKEAAEFYCSIFDDAEIINVEGMVVSFRLCGQPVNILNGGETYTLSPAFSLCVNVDSQEEIDRYWAALTADGGRESRCGWLVDKYGVSWQIVPRVLPELLSDEKSRGKAQEALFKMTKIVIQDLM